MSAEVKYRGPSPEERIAARLRNSGDHAHADVVTHQGEGPTRVNHNIHHCGSQGGSTHHNEHNEGSE